MEFIVFSDAQFYSNPYKSFLTGDGMTSWFKMQLSVLDCIVQYTIDNNINLIIHNGDLFEEKNKIDVPLYNIVWDKFYRYKHDNDIKFIFNTGNHEIMNYSRDSSLSPFKAVGEVINKVTGFFIDTHYLRFIPFGMLNNNNIEVLDDVHGKQILFTHEDMIGLVYRGSNENIKNRFDPKLLVNWNIVFNGHIHDPQKLNNVIIVGAPIRHDFGECTNQRRFIHYKDGEVISIPTDCPDFITIDNLTEDMVEKILKDDYNFYRIVVDPTRVDEKLFQKYNVFPEFLKTNRKSRGESSIDTTTNIVDEIEWYVGEISNTELEPDKLINVGHKIVNRR